MHIRTYVYMYVYLYIYIYIDVCVCVSVCMSINMYVHIYFQVCVLLGIALGRMAVQVQKHMTADCVSLLQFHVLSAKLRQPLALGPRGDHTKFRVSLRTRQMQSGVVPVNTLLHPHALEDDTCTQANFVHWRLPSNMGMILVIRRST